MSCVSVHQDQGLYPKHSQSKFTFHFHFSFT
jgi:hypothetical protein